LNEKVDILLKISTFLSKKINPEKGKIYFKMAATIYWQGFIFYAKCIDIVG